MKRLFVLMGFVALFCSGLALADNAATQPAAAPAALTGIRAEVLQNMNYAADKLMQLADATPAEKFAWRPAEGVRSISEVYVHVAGANYLLAQILGKKPPVPFDEKDEKTITEKSKVIANLKQSMDYLNKLVSDIPDSDLDKEIDYFGRKSTIRGALFGFASHMHEHLGQSIAYARMNGIVPPWTAKEQQEEHKSH